MVGLHAVLAHGGNAQHEGALNLNGPAGSGLFALGHVRGPGLAGFRLDVGEAGARWRIGNADEHVAGGTLNLPAGELWFALQRLVAVGAIEFEFIGVHSLHLHHAQTVGEKDMKNLVYTF
jgi:hypothetical protein